MKIFNFAKITSLLLFISTSILAQMSSVPVPTEEVVEQEDFTWWYISLAILAVALAGAIFWWLSARKARKAAENNIRKSEKKKKSEDNSLDADKELEWLRKNQKIINKRGKKHGAGQKLPNNLPQTSNVFERSAKSEELKSETENSFSGVLPIFSIQRLELARPFSPLSISNDEALMSAIEQVQDEYEEDEQVRDLSLRILAAFKTRNAVEALSQIALYDLSSNLRSKAASTLAEFDHESVFEPILLACADPTREVRAASARGLFRLSFDRADAWTRIAETNDEFKMRASARAAIEADLVKRSFERLVHTDLKSAYEAFALVGLLLRAGETSEVFEALTSHRDMNVRRAVLHCIKITKEPNALDGLYTLLEKANLPADLQKEVDETIQEIGLVTA
ncbi:MAG TPA: HEAT repeat domain-containing protein [Pyrinomonadaceae bacterium]|jgi:hypothetical protein